VVPDTNECLALLQEHHVPEHIIEHSRMVHKVALPLCRALIRRGEELDCAMVEAGSLLHDIAKMASLDSGEGHAEAGARLLTELGFPEVGEIVRQHVVLDDDPSVPPVTEAAIVHYADKRVKHTEIVPLAERFQDLKERYGKTPAARRWMEEMESRSILLEKSLFRELPIRPEDICVRRVE
jgi:uncharacterized protein